MSKAKTLNPKEYISALNINGLNGRVMVLPAKGTKAKRDILFLYGHHSSLERMIGIAEVLTEYGTVTMPDFPGFGGMDSFYKVHSKPTLDNMADYLAAFIKMRYSRKQVTIAGMSFGFVVATRMLQKYPELTKKVDLLVSVVGFANGEALTFSAPRSFMYRTLASVFKYRFPAIFFKQVCLHPLVLKTVYSRTHNAKNKFRGMSGKEKRRLVEFEVYLWRCNDVRTYMSTTLTMFDLDLTKEKIAMPVYHISVEADQYFDNKLIEKDLALIFSKVHMLEAHMDNHAPTVIATAEDARGLFPDALRTLLASK
jgi:pimeloyl-ACP methyl ester carboxylesterase